MGKKVSINKLCRCCMASMENADGVCPICGFDKAWYSPPREHLRLDYILASRYMVGTSIAEDDDEITYIGWDLTQNMKVLIKEYYPKDLVLRERTDEVGVLVDENILLFEDQVNQYLYLTEELATSNDLNGMTKVMDAFAENHTSYQVCEYPIGISLQEYLDQCGGKIGLMDTLNILESVIETLITVNSRGIIHKNVSPHNIYITEDGKVTLSGFSTKIGKKDISYGPWTDAFGICKTIYHMITGQNPKGMTEDNRGYSNDYDLIRPTGFGVDISFDMEEILMRGLSGFPTERYRSLSELYENLYNFKQCSQGYQGNEMVPRNMKHGNQLIYNNDLVVNTNQSKDGQRDMNNNNNDMNNDMNNANRQRMGMGQPRVNPGAMNGQPRVNPNQMPGQPRINTGQVNVGQMQNTQRLNTDFNQGQQRPDMGQRGPAPGQGAPRPAQPQGFQNTQRIQPGQPMGPQQMNQARPTPTPAPNMMQPGGNVQRPGVPPQGRPFPNPQAGMDMQGRPQAGMSVPPMNPSMNSPMAYPDASKNRKMPVQIGKQRGAVNLAGESKLQLSTIITIVVCAIIVGITIYSVVSKSKDDKASAGNNTQASSQSSATEEAKASVAPEIEVYDIKWENEELHKIASDITGIGMEETMSTEDLKNIVEMDLSLAKEPNLTSLTDIQHFQRLQKLNLAGTKLEDVTPLSKLKVLSELDLRNNKTVTDVSSLASIKTLQKLILSNTKITDFSALESIPLVAGRTCEVTLELYYYRTNNDYDNWNFYLWGDGTGTQYPVVGQDGFASTTVTLTTKKDQIGLIMSRGDFEEKDIAEDRYIPLQSNAGGSCTIKAIVKQGESKLTVTY